MWKAILTWIWLWFFSQNNFTIQRQLERRQYDPVVLTGTDLPELIGRDPKTFAAFMFDQNVGTLVQVPLQIDEKHWVDWEVLKHGDCRVIGRGEKELVYADPNTYSGLDEDPTFDTDDELVFMARHLGPSQFKQKGMMSDLVTEIAVVDPLMQDQILGYLYIVEAASSQQRDDLKLVDYLFNLTTKDPVTGSNDYFDVYKFLCEDPSHITECKHKDMNPEDTWFKSQHYERHFKENWYSDQLKITTRGADGQNFFGMQEFQFTKQSCERCTNSFIHGPTAFLTNKNGPVRAIRSWVGANSGVITRRDAIMYEQREDQATYIHVHSIPGIFDYVNYKYGSELTFYNCRNLDGFQVDGVMSQSEKEFDNDLCPWEMVTGSTGTYLRATDIDTNVGDWIGTDDPSDFLSSWYYDNKDDIDMADGGEPVHPNGWHLCTSLMDGQKEAWGSHGFKEKNNFPGVPNTDYLRYKTYDNLPEEACQVNVHEDYLFDATVYNRQYYLPPDTSVNKAQDLYETSIKPLMRQG